MGAGNTWGPPLFTQPKVEDKDEHRSSDCLASFFPVVAVTSYFLWSQKLHKAKAAEGALGRTPESYAFCIVVEPEKGLRDCKPKISSPSLCLCLFFSVCIMFLSVSQFLCFIFVSVTLCLSCLSLPLSISVSLFLYMCLSVCVCPCACLSVYLLYRSTCLCRLA